MARRIRWQILIAVVSSALVLALMSYLAVSTAAVQRPVEGGDYVEGLLYSPQQINPLISDPSNDQGAADLQALIFDGLVRIGPTGLPEPALAQGWQVDETGLVYTFFLRPGVQWHDGTPLTMEDVLFTIRAIQGPAFTGNPSLSAIWKTAMVEQLDDNTLQCRLSAPFASFFEFANFPILPAHLLADVPPEQWSAGAFARSPVGTGPYRLTQLSGEHALLDANEDYYRGRPYINSIELRFYDVPDTAINDLVRGTIQGLQYTSASDFRSMNLPRSIERRSAPLDGYTTLTFNLRTGPLSDQALRSALAIGLDRTALIDAVFDGQAGLIDTPILPQWWFAAPEVGLPRPDVERASALLDELGYTRGPDGMRASDGTPLTIELLTDTAADRIATAEEIARQWEVLGVGVTVAAVEPAELQRRLAAHEFTAAIHAWQRLGGDPDIYELWHSEQADGGRNYAGLRDQQIDDTIITARNTGEFDTRAAAYASFQRRFVELVPSIPLYQPYLIYATSNTLGGVTIDQIVSETGGAQLLVGRESRFRQISTWFLQSSREIRDDLKATPASIQ